MSTEFNDGTKPDDDGWSEADAAPLQDTLERQPPQGSPMVIERFPDGVTIQVPAAGIWKGSKGLFVLAILWNLIVGVISFCLLGALFGAVQVKGGPGPGWIGVLMMSLFWAVGIGILLGAINMGKRRAALAVTGGSLLVIQTGIFGSKRRQWEPNDVEEVNVGPSGMTVNDVPVMELRIFDGGGKFSMLAGRTDEELEWLARELRAALQIRSRMK